MNGGADCIKDALIRVRSEIDDEARPRCGRAHDIDVDGHHSDALTRTGAVAGKVVDLGHLGGGPRNPNAAGFGLRGGRAPAGGLPVS